MHPREVFFGAVQAGLILAGVGSSAAIEVLTYLGSPALDVYINAFSPSPAVLNEKATELVNAVAAGAPLPEWFENYKHSLP